MQINEIHLNGNQFNQYTDDSVTIKGIKYQNNIIVTNDNVLPFPIKDITQIKLEDLQAIIQFAPDLLIFGSGNKVVYPPLLLIKALYDKKIGVEVMPIQALCRTFNFLLGEGRQVAGILLFA